LPIPPSPAYKVLASSKSQRRNYLQPFLSHTSSSRANFFLTYDDRDRLDDPPARLDNFATPSRILQLYSWNIETFIGVEFFLNFKRNFIVGIYCLQETKSQHTGIVKLSHTHFYLSGTADDPYAGVGFAVYNPLTHPVPTNFSYHSHTLSSPHASPRLFASPILALWYKYLGHIIGHPTSPEFHICFNNVILSTHYFLSV
jgi:hypothetical protein